MSEIDRTDATAKTETAAHRQAAAASAFICAYSVDKLAWRSRITAEQSMAILRAAGLAKIRHDRG
jgi:hypothetical protein